ncbi:MAG: hypothetical protein ACK4ND_18210 [Cytophagaceae bacterium]
MRAFNLILSLIFSVCVAVNAQDCDTYFPMNKGASYEMESFNANDKKQSRMVYNVKDVKTSGGTKEATIASER